MSLRPITFDTLLASWSMRIAKTVFFLAILSRIKFGSVLDFFTSRTLFLCKRGKTFSMQFLMFMYGDYLKVRNIVIQLVTVNMVNVLVGPKRSSNVFLHNITMFKNPFSIHCHLPISSICNIPSTPRCIISMKRIAMKLQPLVVFITKPFGMLRLFTVFHFAWLAGKEHVMPLAKTLRKVLPVTSLYFTQPLSIILLRIHIATVRLYGEIRKVLLSYFLISQF